MRLIFGVLVACLLATAPRADHVPETRSANPFDVYQFDAAQKRYADLLTLAQLLEDVIAITGAVPMLDQTGQANPRLWQTAVLGQPEAVDHVMRHGSPFGFSMLKFTPDVLADRLADDLDRAVRLPLDPQRIGVDFAPGYFVFLRRDTPTSPGRYVVVGAFAQPVAHATQVADGVHLLAISNQNMPFVVPVQLLDSFDAGFVTHAIAAGKAADRIFVNTVQIAIERP